jgi:hypothetical protein
LWSSSPMSGGRGEPMKTNYTRRRGHSAPAPHFTARFRQVEVETAEAVEKLPVDRESWGREESLIPDPRAQLRPSEHVERKLAVLLQNTALPVSFLLVPASS